MVNENSLFQRMKIALTRKLEKWMPREKGSLYCIWFLSCCAAGICFMIIGKDLLPKTNNGQLQIRIKEPDGTSLEKTERTVKKILEIIDSTVNGHVSVSSTYVGLVPSSYGSSNLYIFNSGTHEAVMQVNLDENYKVKPGSIKGPA